MTRFDFRSSLARRSGAVLLLVLFCGTVLFGLVLPLSFGAWSHFQIVGNEKMRLQSYWQTVGNLEAHLLTREDLKTRLAEAAAFPHLVSSADAELLMARNLRQAADTAGATAVRMEPLAAAEDALGMKFGQRVFLEGDIKIVDDFFESIGLSFPYYYYEFIIVEPVESGHVRLKMEAVIFSYGKTEVPPGE